MIGDVIRSEKLPGKKALYVVETARLQGGSTAGGINSNLDWPDGWHIEARRLAKNKNYNPKNSLIEFYQSGCFGNMISEVELVGKMQMGFTNFRPINKKKSPKK